MTAVGKIQERQFQDKHTLQLTVKVNSLLVKIGYRTAFFSVFPQSHMHGHTGQLHTSFHFNSQGTIVLLCSWPPKKAIHGIDVVAAEPIKTLHIQFPYPQRSECTVHFWGCLSAVFFCCVVDRTICFPQQSASLDNNIGMQW